MTTNDISFAVDKLAGTLGLALSKVQPVAEEAVRQYALRSLVTATFCALGSVVCVLLAVGVIPNPIDDDEEFGWIVRVTALALLLGLSVGLAASLGRAVAPLPSILGL